MAQWLMALVALAEGLGFGSQHPHGGSQPSLSPVPGNPILSSDLLGYQAYVQYTYIHTGKTLIQ